MFMLWLLDLRKKKLAASLSLSSHHSAMVCNAVGLLCDR
jgi:hypothetical protein